MPEQIPIHQVIEANEALGQHFFEPATLRFFDSIFPPFAWEGPGGVFFTTSEQFHAPDGSSAPRAWTVRRQNPDGSISTVGDFQAHETEAEAEAEAEALAADQVAA